jgi:protein KIAA0825
LKQNQVVLQETICSGIVGGRLDFPRYASFASVKIVLWLEDEYFAAYSRHSGLLDLSGFIDFSTKKKRENKK